jgi:uncharacterized protein (TIGR03032 family)
VDKARPEEWAVHRETCRRVRGNLCVVSFRRSAFVPAIRLEPSISTKTGNFEPLTFCPGFLRGLAFAGDYAIVGLSGPRGNEKTFGGLALDDELKSRGAEPRSGLQVIDLRTGDVAHWVRLEGMISELYDVITLPGVVRPVALGFKTDEIQHLLTIDQPGVL